MGRWMRPAFLGLSFLAASVLAGAPGRGDEAAGSPEVRVILWFDTEDYLLPASDDAAKRIAGMLAERGIRGTFKVVGEKARALERRGRTDVIEALRKHDIAFHSNFHSVHPTPAEYLAEAGWEEGVAEFARREGPGAADVRRIFRVERLACYGQPGSSWGPETYAGLARIGVAPCYVDDGDHVEMGGQPFRYCGVLTVYGMGGNCTRMDLHAEGGLERGCRAFEEVVRRLRAAGGGLISIYYHPCEWVHREFWDGVNFRRGANPPREEWREPPQREPEETEAAFERYGKYLDFLKTQGVAFVTASDLLRIYADPVREEGASLDDALRAAREIAGSGKVDALEARNGRYLSPADQLAALVEALARTVEEGAAPSRVDVPELLGPAEPPPAAEAEGGAGEEEVDWPAFRAALLDVRDALRVRRQVPSRVFLGARAIAPADFLGACAGLALEALGGEPRKGLPARGPGPAVRIRRGVQVATERHIARDTPGLFGGWIIHREGFRAPHLLEMGRLQAWTLKPAAAVTRAR